MRIYPIQSHHLQEVMKLHQNNLTDISASFGTVYLRQMYTSLLSDTNTHIFLGAFNNNNLIGMLIASNDIHTSFQQIKPHMSLETVLSTIMALLSGKIAIGRIFRRIIFEKKITSYMNRKDTYILILVIDNQFRRRRVATKLFHALLQRKPSSVMWVDAKHSDKAALKFYTNIGFIKHLDYYNTVLLRRYARVG